MSPLFAGEVRADSTLRCGRRLVTEGTSSYKVRKMCGEPQHTAHRTEWRPMQRFVRVPCGPGATTMCTRVVRELVEVQVEEWTYDFGPQRFMRHVTFEQGKVVQIATGDYGGDR